MLKTFLIACFKKIQFFTFLSILYIDSILIPQHKYLPCFAISLIISKCQTIFKQFFSDLLRKSFPFFACPKEGGPLRPLPLLKIEIKIILVIFNFSFEVSFWMCTCWAHFWCFFAKVDVSTVSTFPSKRSISFECCSVIVAF